MDVINTHSKFYGKIYYVVLTPDRNLEDSVVGAAIKSALKCTDDYVNARMEEVEESGETCIYASNLERCELVQALLDREGKGLLTELSSD